MVGVGLGVGDSDTEYLMVLLSSLLSLSFIFLKSCVVCKGTAPLLLSFNGGGGFFFICTTLVNWGWSRFHHPWKLVMVKYHHPWNFGG